MSFIRPNSYTPMLGGLTLEQYIQTVLVGLSGIDGTLVRPAFQTEPANQPAIDTNWVSFKIGKIDPQNADVFVNNDENLEIVEFEKFEVECFFYGKNGEELIRNVCNGFQIPQNNAELLKANVGFIDVDSITKVPDFFNDRFIQRWQVTIRFLRKVQVFYSPAIMKSASIITFEGAANGIFETKTEVELQNL